MEKSIPHSTKASFIEQIIYLPEQIEALRAKINDLSEEISNIKSTEQNGWMTLDKAAAKLGKSKAALYQRIKHKDKPMPEGVVWKQDGGLGTQVFIDAQQYLKHI